MLHALVEYARNENLATEPGFKPKMVRWLLVFSSEGKFLGLQDLRGENRKGKGREFSVCPDLTQPEMIAIGGGCRHFLVDNLEVIALLTKEVEVDDKMSAKHDFFVKTLIKAAECLPVLQAIGSTLNNESDLELIREKLIEAKAKPTDAATLVVEDEGGPSIAVDGKAWHAWWRTFRSELLNGKKESKVLAKRRKKETDAKVVKSLMRCFLSGEPTKPIPTHNKIEGLSDVGGLSMGDVFTSFDKDAFTSFGLEQGANAAVSEIMAKTYVSALNDLIRKRSFRLAGVKIVYWYDKPAEREVELHGDPLRELLEGSGWGPIENSEESDATLRKADKEAMDEARRAKNAERVRAESSVQKLLHAVHSGEKSAVAEAHFYALTLSANSGRVIIRDWMEGRFDELLESINTWFDDLAIIDRYGQMILDRFKFYSLVAATVRDIKDCPVALQNALLRSAIKNQPIPGPIMALTLHRVRLDVIQGESLRHARYALLKAFCNRNERTPNMTSELNELETKPAYLCGRIMAILARIQYEALGDVGAGVVQRYYAAASTTPALVLGRLIRTAQIAHLPKIGNNDRKGLQVWFDRTLTEIWDKMGKMPPTALKLEEQTLFAMGFYHQKAKRYKNNEEKEENASAE